MIFEGIGRSFSTENDGQYQTIGAFWDELSAKHGRENLQGLGYGWTEHSIEYVIGLKDGSIDGANRRVELPEDGWVSVRGRTDSLGLIYEEIYRGGRLEYEIERFTDGGDCEILYWRPYDRRRDLSGKERKEQCGMKTIGLIGGMSWESTVTYYQVINETIKAELGGLHSAKILMYSVDFDEIEKCQSSGDWARSADILSDAARRLERAGADFIVICTNTMHKVAPEVRGSVSIPLLHIAEVTARKLKAAGITTVGLLGTCYTMTQPFYIDVLKRAGIDVLVPEGEAIKTVNDIIFDELCVGIVRDSSKETLLETIRRLQGRGARGVILGCTELGLLVGADDVELPVFDTALIHAREAALEALRHTV